MHRIRIILDLTILLGLFVLPFWATTTLAIMGLLFIAYYWEFLIFLGSVELLYHVSVSPSMSFVFVTPLAMAAIFLLVQGLRNFVHERVFYS